MSLDEKATPKCQGAQPPITLSYFKIAALTTSVFTSVFSVESHSEPEAFDHDPDGIQM